jgi:hypothetical protein
VPGPGDPAAASSDSLREALVAAAPLVREAGSSMERAVVAVGEGGFEAAITAEGDAVDALGRAQELFFDLRELLEATLGTELRIAAAARSESPDALALRQRAEAALAESQQRNQGRVPRIDALLGAERSAARAARTAPADAGAATGAAPGAASTPSTDPAEIEALERRFARAGELLEEASAAMAEAGSAFAGKTAGSTRRATDWTRVGDAATRAAERLDALRTLFLSLVELLQRLEREQVDLGDRTRSAIALAGPATPRSAETRARMTAIASDQQGLEQRAGAIADALLAQSEARGADASEGSAPSAAPDADTLRRAADHVASAQLAMQEASELFADDQGELPPAVTAQTVARDELRRAIALLAPPPPPEDQEQKNEQEQSQQDRQDESQSGGDEQQYPSEGSGGEEEGQQEEQSEPAESESESQAQEPESEPGQDAEASASEDPAGSEGDPAQLLQGVRDREAERRDANERRERQRRRVAPVEKDW